MGGVPKCGAMSGIAPKIKTNPMQSDLPSKEQATSELYSALEQAREETRSYY